MLPASELIAHVDQFLKAHSAELISLRRELHAHPELSHQEYETTSLLAATLQDFGFEVRAREEGTGFYADLTPTHFDPSTQPTVAIRTDIDALPIQEVSDAPYASTRPGAMHACGHDVHMTIATAAGMAAYEYREQLPGRLRLVYQHAEEVSVGGASDMVSFGAIDGVDAILGVHCDPELEVGRIGLRAGHLTAAYDSFTVTIRGKSGHGARPHHCVDPIRVSSQLLNALYQMPGQHFDARDPVVISVGSIHAGESFNVIPETAEFKGTLRTLTRESRQRLEPVMRKIIDSVCMAHGATYQLDFLHGAPSVVNSAELIGLLEEVGRAVLGDTGIYHIPLPSMGGEDFSYYLQHIPGAMFRLGTAGPGPRTRHLLHSDRFDVDDRAIGLGARLMTRAALTLMERLASEKIQLAAAFAPV